jgi:ABC-type multidrug transport system fused ATPase/permease subunit
LLAAGLVLGYNAKVLKINQIILVFVGVLSIMMQTVYGRLVAIHIPFLGISQFVWRWMFVSCFIVFIILLVMPRISIQWMRTLCALSIVNSFAICALHSGKISLGIRSSTNENIIRDYYYDRSDNVVSPQQWGLAEYFPDYSGLRPDCGVAEGQSILSADFSELEQGLIVSHVMSDAYVTVKEAPVQFVRYVFDGVPIGPRSVCDGRLIFGPFRTGGLLSVDESLVYGVMTVRYLIVVMLVIGGGLLVLRQRDRPGVNAP